MQFFSAVFINSGFVGRDNEAVKNLIDSLISGLDEAVYKTGSLGITYYQDEMPRFNKCNYPHLKVVSSIHEWTRHDHVCENCNCDLALNLDQI